MSKKIINARNSFINYVFLASLLYGCKMEQEARKVSSDVSALQQIIVIPSVPASAKWEVFGTPEYTGGVPGPSDYITLVAEMTFPEAHFFLSTAPAGKFWIAPESARSWLSPYFHAMLDAKKNAVADLSTQGDCREVRTTLRQTGAPVSGFACNNAGKILLYLTLADNSHT